MTAAANPVIWKLTVYRSKWSKLDDANMHLEGPRRSDVLALMRRLADTASRHSAAAASCRDALGGERRYTLTRTRLRHAAYLAQDLQWRGWDEEAWQQSPPTAYAGAVA